MGIEWDQLHSLASLHLRKEFLNLLEYALRASVPNWTLVVSQTAWGSGKSTSTRQNQSFDLACRSTYAFVAPSPSVCLKSSFPSLTIFFLSFEKHSTEEAVSRNPHRLPIYLVTQQTTLRSVFALVSDS